MSKRSDIIILQQKVRRMESLIDHINKQVTKLQKSIDNQHTIPYDSPPIIPTCSVCNIPYKNSYSHICGRPDCPATATCVGSEE